MRIRKATIKLYFFSFRVEFRGCLSGEGEEESFERLGCKVDGGDGRIGWVKGAGEGEGEIRMGFLGFRLKKIVSRDKSEGMQTSTQS